MEQVQVLMSTYNGEKYIKEQIESINNQRNVVANILVRDDGSKDNTQKIIKNYNIKMIKGSNLKPAKSFMELIECSDDNYKFYALSDQDDYWLPNKLNRAIEQIKKYNQDIPIVYFSAKKIVNDKLEYLYTLEEEEKTTLGSAMIKNIATGCTMVFNKKMKTILKKYKPGNIEMHDAWIYRLCLAIGGIAINDKESYILYRQHENNVIGVNNKVISRLKRRFRSYKNKNRYREKMAKELLNGYKNDMANENCKILESFANYRYSIKYKMNLLFNKNIKLKSKKENIIFKIAVILNII